MNRPGRDLTFGLPHPERADAARNRRVLPDTARKMRAEQGADKITMDGLAERAGLGKLYLSDVEDAPKVTARLSCGWEDLVQRVCR